MYLISYSIAILIMAVTLLMLGTAVVNLFVRTPYVPTRKRVVHHLIDIAGLKDGEKVYDLGCGDGRLLLEAEKKAKVETYGYELAPIPYLLALAKKWSSKSKMNLFMKNFYHTNLQNANVIFCYLGPDVMQKLAPKFKKECQKGTRIFSHTFHMEGFTPVKTWPKNPQLKLPTVYLYQV